MKELIFVAHAEIGCRRLVRNILEQAGCVVREFSDAAVLEEAIATQPSLVIVAATVPGENGTDLCRTIRRNSLLAATRVVLLLSGNTQEERKAGREAGADDCISSPFTPAELLSRVQTILQRPSASSMEPGEIVIDRAAMKLSIAGNEVTTTTLEFRLVDYLAQHRGRVCSRDLLLDAVWGEMQFVTPRSVDACIRRLRDKIEPNRARPTYLKTVRGVGYRFDANPVWPISAEGCTCRVCSPSIGPTGIGHVGTPRSKRVAAQA